MRISGMIAIPASLGSNFIHIAGMPIHIAPEYTIHIVGIRTQQLVVQRPTCMPNGPTSMNCVVHGTIKTTHKARFFKARSAYMFFSVSDSVSDCVSDCVHTVHIC